MCTYRSKNFSKAYFISQYFDNDIENALVYKIVEVIIFPGLIPHLLVSHSKINKYNKHYAAFEIDVNNSSEKYSIVSIESLSGPPINLHKISCGLNFIRSKQYC